MGVDASVVFSVEAALQLGYCSLFNPGEGGRKSGAGVKVQPEVSTTSKVT